MNARYTRWINHGINNLILIILIASFLPQTLSGQTCDRQRDSLALVALYNATDGPNWTITWDLNRPMREWYGVILDSTGCVQKLILNGGRGLSGELPDQVFNLENLEVLELFGNNLTGTISSGFENLTKLRSLNLGQNNFHGQIPTEIGKLSRLNFLNLQNYNLTGNIPIEV